QCRCNMRHRGARTTLVLRVDSPGDRDRQAAGGLPVCRTLVMSRTVLCSSVRLQTPQASACTAAKTRLAIAFSACLTASPSATRPAVRENRSPSPAPDADSARLDHSAVYHSTPGSGGGAPRPHSWAFLPLFRDALRQYLLAVKRVDRACPYQNVLREHSVRRAAARAGTPVRLSRPGPSVCLRPPHAYTYWAQTVSLAHPEERTAGLFLASESLRRTVWCSAGVRLA